MNYTIVERGNWKLAINPVDSLQKAKRELNKLQKNYPNKHFWIGTL